MSEEKHESYGLFGVSRSTGGDSVLFGSHLRHNQQIRIRICRASVKRDLHQNWIHADQQPLIEVVMSPTQWAEAITSMGMGDGVPCTIRYVEGERMAEPPMKSERAKIRAEFKQHMEEIGRKLRDGLKKVETLMLKKAVTKADLKSLHHLWGMLQQQLVCDTPFIHTQFDEAMDETVAEAKGEVEAFVTNVIAKAGLAAIAEKLAAPELLEDRSDAAGASGS